MRRKLLFLSLLLLLVMLLVCLGAPGSVPPQAQAADPTLSDVPIDHPYYEAVEGMAAANVINGFDDGIFRPGDPVIRQQFVKMIVLTLGLDRCPLSSVLSVTWRVIGRTPEATWRRRRSTG